MIPSGDRGAIVALLEEGTSRGASAKAVANLFGLATRTLRRWGLMIRAQGFSCDQRMGSSRYVMHRFSEAVAARKDEAPSADQAAITNVAVVMPCSGGGGLIQTTSG